MNVSRDDTETLLAHPENSTVLARLRDGAVPASGVPYPSSLGHYELHTHPDLHERLQQISMGLVGSDEAAAFGHPVLAGPSGVVFAVAQGTARLAFRLAGADLEEALARGGTSAADLGDGWVAFYAWDPEVPLPRQLEDQRHWCEVALRQSAAPPGRPRSLPSRNYDGTGGHE